MKRDVWLIALLASLAILIGLFTRYLGPHILGDTQSYVDTMSVLAGHAAPEGFKPNRVLTTFGSIELIRALSVPFGGIYNAWFFVNCAFFLLAGFVFYKLLLRLFGSKPTALLGTLFLAGNYGFLLFGLHYLMDIGGWSFYIFSLYFLYRYAQSKSRNDLLLAAVMVGVGGLFKEYAFLGAVAIGAYLIMDAWPGLNSWAGWKRLAGQGALTASIALVPVCILYAWAYRHFGYTYADWFGANASHYIYPSRIKEYIKALGSLFNVLAPLFLGGAYVLSRTWRETSREARIFIGAAFVSMLPVFVWPAITQRILAVTVPAVVIVACLLFKRYEQRWYIFLPILALYILATFFMDSYLLIAVNLPF